MKRGPDDLRGLPARGVTLPTWALKIGAAAASAAAEIASRHPENHVDLAHVIAAEVVRFHAAQEPGQLLAAVAAVADEYEPILAEEHRMREVMTEADFWFITTGNVFMHTSTTPTATSTCPPPTSWP